MEKILISACLIGDFTRYDGGNNYLPIVEKLKEKYDLIPFCPEVMGGLSIPRDPCEIRGSEVVTKAGVSKTKEYNLGAKKALDACKLFGIRIAILKESSPSCGVRNIHDGHFNQTKIPGKGITTRLLEENGIACYSSFDDLSFLIEDPFKKEKEYVSYEERDYDLRHRRFGKKKPLDSTRKKVSVKEDKPVDEINENQVAETPAPVEEKKEFKKSYNSSFKKRGDFHHDGKKSFHHDGKKNFHHDGKKNFHHDGEFKKDFSKKDDRERKPYFKKDENGENKKPYFKKDGAHKSFGHGGKGSFKKSFHGKSSYSKGPKRYGKSNSSYRGNKDKKSA